MKILVFLLLVVSVCTQAQTTKRVLIEGQGTPIVLLNGGTSDMSVYTSHSRQLASKYKVIRMEQFNIQAANEGWTLPQDYSIQMESEAIKLTLDSLHITDPIVLVGHSYGGLIALDFALNHSNYIRSLVLLEPPVFSLAEDKKESPEGMEKTKELTNRFIPQAEITEEMVRQFRCDLMNCDTFDIHKHPLWSTWVKQKNRLRGLSVVSNYKVNLNELHAFQKPVLIITGTQTVLFHKRIDELLAKELSLAKTAMIPGGHTAVYSNPGEFTNQLLKFLQ